jgi:tRNA uridine 5-carboxymethylaminomethyl modification enzyme
LGLIDDAAWAAFEAKLGRAAAFARLLESARLTEGEKQILRCAQDDNVKAQDDEVKAEDDKVSHAGPSPARGDLFAQLLKRPATTIEQLLPALLPRMKDVPEFAPWLAALTAASYPQTLPAWVRNEMKTVETGIKFAGYLAQQQRSMSRLRKDEARAIPAWFDYHACSGLSREMVEKLSRVRPATLGQASRIAGVTPAAVSLVQCFLEIQARARPERQARVA